MLDTISMAETLKDGYREIFEKADLYSSLGGFTPETVENKLMNLYQRLREAQKNETPVEEIVGNDIETFCKEYFKEDKKEKIHKVIWNRLYDLLKWILIFTVADLLLLEEGENIVTAQSNLAPFIYGIAIGLGIDIVASYYLKPIIFKNKKMKPMHYYVIIIGFFVVALILTMVLAGDILVSVNSFPLLVISGGYVIVYLLVRSIWRYKKYGRITKNGKEEKKFKKHFNDVISEKTLLKSISEIMEKRFERINKKKRKRGKAELTQEEFAALIRKEIKWKVIYEVILGLWFGTIVLYPTITIILHDGILNGIVFGVILTIVEVAIYAFFYKADKTNARIQTKILEECENRNISISEYVEKGYEDGTFL